MSLQKDISQSSTIATDLTSAVSPKSLSQEATNVPEGDRHMSTSIIDAN